MIEVPHLDTIAFDALVDEGRGLIPRFAPAWTDHNLHDPGMTLLDLLAWFVDQQVYRIGFVSDAHLRAFAALLGVKPRAAVPSRGLIWPRAGALAGALPLAAGSRANPLGQPDLPFAVARDVHLSATRIDWIVAQRAEGTRRLARGDDDSVALDPDTRSIELILHDPVVSVPPVSLGLAYAEAIPAAAPPARVDYRGAGGVWHRSEAEWVPCASGPGAAAGALLVAIAAAHGPVDRFRLDLGVGLPRRLLPVRIALDAVPIVQVEHLPDIKIGEGTGWADLERPFDLAGGTLPESEKGLRPPAVRTTRGLEPPIAWTAVADFDRSGPSDPHYVLDEARQIIRFGNGINGMAPGQGDAIFRGAFDVTLGGRGNLAVTAGWELASAGTKDGKGFGTNPDPVAGGADAWGREDLLAELRRRARLRGAMLTDPELVRAATGLEGYGVDRAEALARYLPSLPGHEVPGARTLLLRAAPDVEPSDSWLDSIERALEPRRVLGERLVLIAAVPVEIRVETVLLVEPGADRERIRADAEQRLRDRLAVVRRREDQEIDPWPSGRPVTAAELGTLLASVDGLSAVLSLGIARAGGQAATAASLPLARTEVAVAGEISIRFKAEGR